MKIFSTILHTISKMAANEYFTLNCTVYNEEIVFLVGAALDLVSSQRGRDYNGKIYCVTPTQYGGRYIT